MRYLLLLSLMFLAACATNAAIPPTDNPTEVITKVARPTRTIVMQTKVLTSPDGVVRGEVVCYFLADWVCSTHFPNGTILNEAPEQEDWSPDSTFAVVCIGATHDTPCQSFEVWDMIKGEKRAEFSSRSYCYAWSPHENHQLAYLSEDLVIGHNQWQLYFLDASRGEKVRQREYPDWFRSRFDTSADGSGCRRPLDVVIGNETPAFILTDEPVTQVP